MHRICMRNFYLGPTLSSYYLLCVRYIYKILRLLLGCTPCDFLEIQSIGCIRVTMASINWQPAEVGTQLLMKSGLISKIKIINDICKRNNVWNISTCPKHYYVCTPL